MSLKLITKLSGFLPQNSPSPIPQLRTSDPEVRETFEASEGPARSSMCRQALSAPFNLVKWGYTHLRSLVQVPLRPLIYQASSGNFKSKMDPDRLEQSREGLRKIGGQTIAIKTQDGDWIEAMYFDIENFKRAVVDLGGQFYIDREGNQSIRSYSPRLTALLVDTLKFEGSYKDDPELDDVEYFEVMLPKANLLNDRMISDKHVHILTQGNACIYEMNRGAIRDVLQTGQGCLVFNIRGTGRSHGKPNERRTYFDIEAVYQFLKTKGFRDDQITIHGYCLGAGLATDLASKHPVNLILDRPFAKIGDVMADVSEKIGFSFFKINPEKSTSRWMAFRNPLKNLLSSGLNCMVISYDNLSKIRKVSGPICYLHSDIDEVIPSSSRQKMKQALISQGATVQTSDQFGHCDAWDEKTAEVHQNYLKRYWIFGRYPATSVPAHISLARLDRRNNTKARRARMAATLATGAGIGAFTPSGPLSGSGLVAAGRSAMKEYKKQANRKPNY